MLFPIPHNQACSKQKLGQILALHKAHWFSLSSKACREMSSTAAASAEVSRVNKFLRQHGIQPLAPNKRHANEIVITLGAVVNLFEGQAQHTAEVRVLARLQGR